MLNGRLFAPSALALTAVLLSASLARSAEVPRNRYECRWGDREVVHKIGSVTVHVRPGTDKDLEGEPHCHLEVRSRDGTSILAADDDRFEILFDNHDVNGDGILDLVLESFSGGAHCCWTYYFVSLGPHPKVLLKLENERDAEFLQDEKTGRIFLFIEDGSFDYFDEVCHACSPFPVLHLRLDGDKLVDVSREYQRDYDETIRAAQKDLTKKEPDQFKAVSAKPSDRIRAQTNTRYKVLTIVLAYLYSGREEHAHQALRELWPPFDQERIWNAVLEQRRNGLLCYTRDPAHCGDAATSTN